MIYLKIFELLKNNYKAIVFGLLIAIVVYLFLMLRHETHRANDAEQGRDAAIKIGNGLGSEIMRYKNKLGDSVLRIQAVTIPKSQVDELLKQNDLKWLRKLEGIKNDGSNLQSAFTFSSEFIGPTTTTIKYLPCKDSVKTFAYDLHDGWNDIHAVVVDTPKLDIRDRYYATIELIRPKGWFWKFQWYKREAIGEITNSNKKIRIDSAAVFTIK